MSAAPDRHAIDRKLWSTLVARAAIRGFALWRTDASDGPLHYVLVRWGVARMCDSLLEVEEFLEVPAQAAR